MTLPERNRVYNGDMRKVLATWPDNCVDAVVCDPPYELGLMGKSWDSSGVAFDVETWRQSLRVLKPGGHLLAFSGTRTYHRMAVAIEDAGFEIRDQIQWLYGQGFPKSLDVSKAIDKAAGAKRKVVGWKEAGLHGGSGASLGKFTSKEKTDNSPNADGKIPISEPATEAAKTWDGWGTALKPANEPVCLARKPLSESNVASNVIKWGTGALNLKACRIGSDLIKTNGRGAQDGATPIVPQDLAFIGEERVGRWPSNVLMDEAATVYLDEQMPGIPRFFYCAKPDTAERGENLDDKNFHPTVKPILVMQYLVKIVTPKGGVVVDPFLGSGTTAKACKSMGVDWIGVEISPEYVELAEGRMSGELF